LVARHANAPHLAPPTNENNILIATFVHGDGLLNCDEILLGRLQVENDKNVSVKDLEDTGGLFW
jgi:hypothetical protein